MDRGPARQLCCKRLLAWVGVLLVVSGCQSTHRIAMEPAEALECWACDFLIPIEYLRRLRMTPEPGDGDHYILFVHGRHAGLSHVNQSRHHDSIHKLREDQREIDPLLDDLASQYFADYSEDDTGVEDYFTTGGVTYLAKEPYWRRDGNPDPADYLYAMALTEAPFEGQDVHIRYVGWDTDLPVFGWADAQWRGGSTQWADLKLWAELTDADKAAGRWRSSFQSGGRQLAMALARYCHKNTGNTCDVYTHSTGALVASALTSSSTWGPWIHDNLNVLRIAHLAGAHGGSKAAEKARKGLLSFMTAAGVDESLQRSVARTWWNHNVTYGHAIETVSGVGNFSSNPQIGFFRTFGSNNLLGLNSARDGTLENHTLCSRRWDLRFPENCKHGRQDMIGRGGPEYSVYSESYSHPIDAYANHYVIYSSYYYDHSQAISAWSMLMWWRYIAPAGSQQPQSSWANHVGDIQIGPDCPWINFSGCVEETVPCGDCYKPTRLRYSLPD